MVSTLLLEWYDVAMSANVKSVLKKGCAYVNVKICNVEQRRNNVRQCRHNAVIFNAEFHNVDWHQNNVVNMTIFENLLIWLTTFDFVGDQSKRNMQ